MTKQIAYRFLTATSRAWYVSEVKGDGGKDWGYTENANKAAILNRKQWQSFAKDMREVGSAAYALVR